MAECATLSTRTGRFPAIVDGIKPALPRDVSSPNYGSYGQDIRDRTFRFACGTVELCRALMNESGVGSVLAPQLLRCSTSVGANLAEARGGDSRRDFIAKCRISLKEARESEFRLRVLVATHVGPGQAAETLRLEAGEIAAILGAIVRNARRNAAN